MLQLFAPSAHLGAKRARPQASSASSSAAAAHAPSVAELTGGEGATGLGAASGSAAARSFEELGVSAWACRAAAGLAMTTPTAVQSAAIPAILRGARALVAAAPTGSGKTASFVLPVLAALAADPFGPFCLVLEPTRELAFQVAEAFSALGATIGVRVAVVVGGADQVEQGVALARAPHVIVATPGRLAHHVCVAVIGAPGGGKCAGCVELPLLLLSTSSLPLCRSLAARSAPRRWTSASCASSCWTRRTGCWSRRMQTTSRLFSRACTWRRAAALRQRCRLRRRPARRRSR